ncbi:MAG TPA: hypothetical protein VMA95_03820 [Streptosporangiaceae bacterium]|nr:hypothetical protein [Streptosporangiaceae bacterium]
MRPETKILAFVFLVAAVFLGARAVGSALGPVSSTYTVPGGSAPGGGSGSMHMGGGQP